MLRSRQGGAYAASKSPSVIAGLKSFHTYQNYEEVSIIGDGSQGDAMLLRNPSSGQCVVCKRVRVDGRKMEDLQQQVTSVQDVIENQLAAELAEVLQLELADRLERSVSSAVQLNVSSSFDELSEVLEAADKNEDGELTLNELYELVMGAPIDPQLEDMAAQEAEERARKKEEALERVRTQRRHEREEVADARATLEEVEARERGHLRRTVHDATASDNGAGSEGGEAERVYKR